jgi:hypothetical protein
MPEIYVSDGTIRWCESGQLPHETIYCQINDARYGLKEWKVSCAACKGYRLIQLIHTGYYSYRAGWRLVDANFATHFLAFHAIGMTNDCGC